ncbi:MAG: hypothetical protein JNL54_13240 [Kineosporiaceae bacterium]|nr:hypothetical protein [Kineosporiaceae bacterium]
MRVEHAVLAAVGPAALPACLAEVGGQTLLERQLGLLAAVPDVRVVTGPADDAVAALARSVRPDVTVVHGPPHVARTTLAAYAVGARYLRWPALVLDAALLVEPSSMTAFLGRAGEVMAHHPALAQCPAVLAYTEAAPSDRAVATPVPVEVLDGRAVRIGGAPTRYRWVDLALVPPGYCELGSGDLSDRLAGDLPLPAVRVEAQGLGCSAALTGQRVLTG